MIIKETIERQCCDERKDLQRLIGSPVGQAYYFCRHCGRWWESQRYMDAAGSSDSRLVPVPWPWIEEVKP